MIAKGVHLTPAEEEAIGRFLARLVSWLARVMPWQAWLGMVFGLLALAFAVLGGRKELERRRK